MKVRELKQYLSKWSDDEEVCFLAMQQKNRIVWPGGQVRAIGITDSETPVIGLELYQSEPMDEEMVKAAEADEAAAKWIPVTERLPEPEKLILVSFNDFKGPTIGCYRMDNDGSGTFYDFEDNAFIQYDLFVIAWMPLPEPYREV